MKDSKELVIIEGSIPGDMNLTSRAESKAGKYMGLATKIKRFHGLKSIKLYERGTNNTFNELFDKQGTNAMRLCKRAAIMGTLEIFRNLGQVQ